MVFQQTRKVEKTPTEWDSAIPEVPFPVLGGGSLNPGGRCRYIPPKSIRQRLLEEPIQRYHPWRRTILPSARRRRSQSFNASSSCTSNFKSLTLTTPAIFRSVRFSGNNQYASALSPSYSELASSSYSGQFSSLPPSSSSYSWLDLNSFVSV